MSGIGRTAEQRDPKYGSDPNDQRTPDSTAKPSAAVKTLIEAEVDEGEKGEAL